MTVLALGLNHTTAPLDLRGRFAFPLEQLAQAATQLRLALAAPAQAEAVETAILSTCNRTELYVATSQADAAQKATGWLAHQGGVSADDLRSHIYTLRHDAAARHAFRVASGLDSMVLGEVQILGQFKEAVRVADEAGTLGTTLKQLFQRSFAVAKDVRSQTEIGMASISLAAAAVKLSAQVWERWSDVSVLLVGAGEMIELAAKHFAAQNPKRMAFANRTLDRGELLATQFNGQAFRLAELPDRLKDFDVVVSCTASTLPIIGLGAVERALKARRHRPLVMVDLAVPRDIEAEVKGLDDVYLYTIDDLAGIVQRGKAAREAAVGSAEKIIGQGVDSFMQWLAQRESVPLIQRLNAQAENWREIELERARKALARGDDVEAVLEQLAKGITQKALHGAYTHLNDASAPERASAAASIERLFLQRER